MSENKKVQSRQSNIELLRIVSMCMIIAMHYMTKGMELPKLSEDVSLHNIIFRLIFAFCASSVNAYVLISGYFAVDSKWHIGRVIYLWIEVLFYSILIPVILNIAGMADIGSMELSLKQQIFLPVSYEHYWFATAYVMLYLFSPVLSSAIRNLDKRQLGTVIAALVTVFCGFKSVNPYLIPWDKYGDDVIWFMILYLIAGYMRKYGMPFITVSRDVGRETGNADSTAGTGCVDTLDRDMTGQGRRGLCVYIIFSILTFLIAYTVSYIVRATGKLEYYMDMTLCYNYITVLIASIGLFYAFNSMSIRSNKYINRLAGYTFGVYLLHENITLRTLWPKLLGIDRVNGQWYQLLHMIMCIVIVLTVGMVFDAVRTGLFGLILSKSKKET